MVLSLATQKLDPDITVIEIAGRINLGRESGQIEVAVLKALAEGARNIVIDLGQVASIDSRKSLPGGRETLRSSRERPGAGGVPAHPPRPGDRLLP